MRISLLALTFMISQTKSFTPPTSRRAALHSQALPMAPPDGPAGSFFHQVPDDAEDDNKSAEDEAAAASASGDSFEDQVSELLERRKKPPRASKPSTINGVPTSKATGFGKTHPAPKPPTGKPFVAIGTPDPVINDPTAPEFDDQGYTLYTDQETGKKARVFEALVDYPCDFTMKIVGANEGTFVEEIVAVVAEACETEATGIRHSVKVMGKWTSVTVQAPVKTSEMLYTLYEKVDLDPRVKFKF